MHAQSEDMSPAKRYIVFAVVRNTYYKIPVSNAGTTHKYATLSSQLFCHEAFTQLHR